MRVGPYEVIREIGRGSMGAVYLARRDGLERDFALKVMNRSALADAGAVARFHREARLASRIQHEGVVPVVDAGEQDGVPYYVMLHCPGETLHARLRRGPLAPREAALVVRDLADAVAAAHEAGCLHRDLKPANVIVDATTGRPRITDFGLARDAHASDRLTRTGEILGTPFYMAPEQVRGAKDGDQRIDVYALGVILYECLSGAHPYTGTSSAIVAQQILAGRPTPLHVVAADVPPELAAIVERAIAPDRSARFESAAGLRVALDGYLDAAAAAPERDLGRFALRLAVFTLSFVAATVGVVALVVHRRNVAAEERRRVEMERAETERAAKERAAKERAALETAERERERKARESLGGRWKGVYGPHGEEIIEVLHEGDRVVATKVTGDANVPAGEITWRATLRGKTGDGEGRIAGPGFTRARFIPGKLTVVDESTIRFEWTALRSTIEFTRER